MDINYHQVGFHFGPRDDLGHFVYIFLINHV